MKITLDNTTVELTPTGKSYRVTAGERTVDVGILRAQDGKLDLLIGDRRVTARVSSDGAKRWVTVDGRTFLLTQSSSALPGGHGHRHTAGELTAPMPGVVRSVNVVEGESVVKGQTLMVLEAMKMEIRIQAGNDGVVRKLFVKQGQTVEREQLLLDVN